MSEYWTLYSFDIMAIACAFALGALVGYATRRPRTTVMMPTRDAKGRFLPWKGTA